MQKTSSLFYKQCLNLYDFRFLKSQNKPNQRNKNPIFEGNLGFRGKVCFWSMCLGFNWDPLPFQINFDEHLIIPSAPRWDFSEPVSKLSNLRKIGSESHKINVKELIKKKIGRTLVHLIVEVSVSDFFWSKKVQLEVYEVL